MVPITTNLFRPMCFTQGVFHPDGRPAAVTWCAEIFTARTKDNKIELEFYKYKPDTFLFQFCDNGQIISLTNKEGNMIAFPSCNCHGFALMNGDYWIEDPTVLLIDQYSIIQPNEVKPDSEVIVCFMEGDKIAHSAKFKNNHYDHKRNIQMNEKIEINSFNTKYPEYAGLQKVYWKKFD